MANPEDDRRDVSYVLCLYVRTLRSPYIDTSSYVYPLQVPYFRHRKLFHFPCPPISQQAGQAVVPGRLSLKLCVSLGS
jgi:hypothetical protein